MSIRRLYKYLYNYVVKYFIFFDYADQDKPRHAGENDVNFGSLG